MKEEKKEELEVINEEIIQIDSTPVVEQVQDVPVSTVEPPAQTVIEQQQPEEVTYDKSLYDPDYKEKSGKGIIIIAIVIGIVVILAILAVVLLPIFFKSSSRVDRPTDNANWREVGRAESVDAAY